MLIAATSVFCLTLAITKETSGEPVKSKQALALITVGRKHDREKELKKPVSVCNVIAEKGQYTWGKPYKRGQKIKVPENKIALADWKENLRIAKSVHAGEVKDFTGGARFVNSRKLGKRFKTKVKPILIGKLMYY